MCIMGGTAKVSVPVPAQYKIVQNLGFLLLEATLFPRKLASHLWFNFFYFCILLSLASGSKTGSGSVRQKVVVPVPQHSVRLWCVGHKFPATNYQQPRPPNIRQPACPFKANELKITYFNSLYLTWRRSHWICWRAVCCCFCSYSNTSCSLRQLACTGTH